MHELVYFMPNSAADLDVKSIGHSSSNTGGRAVTLYNVELENKWERAKNELLAIQRLRDDWDGLGAKAPKNTIIISANLFFHELKKNARAPDAVIASPNGAIVFNWQQNGSSIEAEISDSQRVEWLQILPDGSGHMSTSDLVVNIQYLQGLHTHDERWK